METKIANQRVLVDQKTLLISSTAMMLEWNKYSFKKPNLD